MPPQQRARKTAAAEPDSTIEQAPDVEDTTLPAAPDVEPGEPHEGTDEPAPICGDCFPGGWGALSADTATAGCEHGAYTR